MGAGVRTRCHKGEQVSLGMTRSWVFADVMETANNPDKRPTAKTTSALIEPSEEAIKHGQMGMSREMCQLKRYVERVQGMLDKDEAERVSKHECLTPEQVEVDNLLAESSPQVFYTSVFVMLTSLVDRHTDKTIKELGLRKLTSTEEDKKNFVEKFRLRANGLVFELSDIQWAEITGMVALRNYFVHGTMRDNARAFANRRGIVLARRVEMSDGIRLDMDHAESDWAWLYEKDIRGLITEVEEFLDAIYLAALNSIHPTPFQ